MQRHQRLRKAEEFERLREVGRTQQHRTMMLSFSSNDFLYNRYGLIIGKRVGNAVTRNRIRRRLREILRALDPQLKPGFDVVLIARQPLAEQPFDLIMRTVNDLFRRAELFKEETL